MLEAHHSFLFFNCCIKDFSNRSRRSFLFSVNFKLPINLILLTRIGKTTKPKKISLKSNEIKKFLNSYYV